MKKNKIGIFLVFMFIGFLVKGQLVSIDAVANNQISCEGDAVRLNVMQVVLGHPTLTYKWYPSETLSAKDVVNPIAKPIITTMFYVEVTDMENSIVLKDSMLITVLPLPVLSAGSDDTICLGQAYRVTNAFLNNTISFEWTHNGKGILLNKNTMTPTYVPTSNELGAVYLKLKSGGILFCKDVIDSLRLDILPLPEAKLEIKTDTIYSDSIYTIHNARIKNYKTFNWDHNGRGSLIMTNGITPKYVPLQGVSENVRIILNVNGYGDCKIISDTIKLRVYASPVVNPNTGGGDPVYGGINDGADTTLCDNSRFLFSKVTMENVITYNWTHNGAGTLLNDKTPNPTYVPKENEEGIVMFILKGTGLFRGRVVADTALIRILKSPVVKFSPDTLICSNKNALLSVTPGFNYLWSTGEITSNITVNPQQNTLYEVKVSTDQGCWVNQKIKVDVSKLFFDVTSDPTICMGDRLYLSVTNSPELFYKWSTGQSQSEIIVSPRENTTYLVTVSNKENCTETVTIHTTVNQTPKIVIAESNTQDETIEVSPYDMLDYKFIYKNQIVQEGSLNSFFYGNIVMPWDSIYVIVTDANGCTNNNLDNFLRKDYYVVPNSGKVNAFTPNGDGINDIFLPNRKVTVFDRGGRILFEGNNGWDGVSKGKEMPEATYFHIAWDFEGNIIQRGAVTLIRK